MATRSRPRPTPKQPRLLDAPLAFTSDGTLVANVSHVFRGEDPQELLAAALASGRQVFIAVVLDEAETAEAKKRIDDAAAELVAVVVRV